MNEQRNYDLESQDTADHKYAYDFDFDVMHPFMLRAMQPFFRLGNCLELGSFKGDFTKRLCDHFSDITCIEASPAAADTATARFDSTVKIIVSRFEEAQLTTRFSNIVLTHVLEHLEDPVGILKRVNDDWLSDGGRLYLICPNAHAASRRIAVKMGLISHCTAITPSEAAHGHTRTYNLDALENDAASAGLRVIHRSGIFFKALANFQWDLAIRAGIVDRNYFEGCYKLGCDFPDMCASIFLVCERQGIK